MSCKNIYLLSCKNVYLSLLARHTKRKLFRDEIWIFWQETETMKILVGSRTESFYFLIDSVSTEMLISIETESIRKEFCYLSCWNQTELIRITETR